MSEIFGAYEFRHFANKGKVKRILEVLREYRKTAKDMADFLWREFFEKATSHIKSQSLPLLTSKVIYLSTINQFARVVWR